MHVGMALNFQNIHDQRDDRDVYRDELALGAKAESLGFESLWCVEHHFTDYILCPNTLQALTYFAGRSSTMQLGTAVVVLPWHNPMRVAEEVSVLDHISDGRVMLGLGRGLGRIEFEGLGTPMSESRERFIESAQMILEGLERGYCEFDGAHVKQPRRDIRPKPFKSFRGRAYAAAVSPESVEIMARLGVGILIVPQKPWDELIPELASYREKFEQYTGQPAPTTLHFGYTYCHEDAEAAHDGAVKYIGAYYDSVLRHYELNADHMKNIKGYEHYAKMQEKVHAYGTTEAVKAFLDLQIWGTPEMCYEKITSISRRIHSEHFNAVLSFGGMPWDDVDRNVRTFVERVMPELRSLAPLSERVLVEAAE